LGRGYNGVGTLGERIGRMENEIRRHFNEKIKYGKNYVYHLEERIPHFHGKGKKSTELTKEVSFKEFMEKVKSMTEDDFI
jgi:hypothetical protein